MKRRVVFGTSSKEETLKELEEIIADASNNNTEEKKCPICNNPVSRVTTVKRGTWDPTEEDKKICFKAKNSRQIVLFIHKKLELDDPVDIDIE